jgi:hypothetical protein
MSPALEFSNRYAGLSSLLRLLVGTALAATLLHGAAAAEAPLDSGRGEIVKVYVDQARLIRTPKNVSSIIIGNPLIADVTLQPGDITVVTGKGYGVTNLLALDRNGSVISEKMIQVQGPRDDVVVVYRGVDRESYSCTPQCQRRITLGDSAEYFGATMNQTTGFAGQAAGAASGPKQ